MLLYERYLRLIFGALIQRLVPISISGGKGTYPNSSRRPNQGRESSEVDIFNDILKDFDWYALKKR